VSIVYKFFCTTTIPACCPTNLCRARDARKLRSFLASLFVAPERSVGLFNTMSIEKQISDLMLFNEKATKLESYSFTQIVFNQSTGFTVSLKNINEQPLLKVERRGPDDESIDAFVLTFRFFIQDNEKSSFRNLASIYDTLLISEEKRNNFKEARDHINNALDTTSFLNIDGVALTYRHIIDTFIYGGLSHANERKKKEYDIWMINPFTNQIVTNEFVHILGHIFSVIFYIRNLNAEVIKELSSQEGCNYEN